MALNLLAALLCGALTGAERPQMARCGILAFKVAAALIGFFLGLAWSRLVPHNWSPDSVWVEISAAFCASAMGLGLDGQSPSDESEGGKKARAPDENKPRLLFPLALQAGALGLASYFGAWTYVLVFASLTATGEIWRTAVDGAWSEDETESSSGPPTAAQSGGDPFDHLAVERPKNFIAALNAAYQRELLPQPDSRFPEPRQIRVVHSVARPPDARSAASTRSVARASGTAAQRKIQTEARDPALGRR